MTFIPSTGTAPADAAVTNDGFFPDLSVTDMRAATGLGSVFATERVAAVLTSAMIEVNAVLADWRAGLAVETLAAAPAPSYGGTSEKVILYRMAVYTRARAALIETTRDYDSTKSGHDRADALEETADSWLRQSAEALARLTDRTRAVVELI